MASCNKQKTLFKPEFSLAIPTQLYFLKKKTHKQNKQKKPFYTTNTLKL